MSESRVPPNYVLFGVTVLPNSLLFDRIVPQNSFHDLYIKENVPKSYFKDVSVQRDFLAKKLFFPFFFGEKIVVKGKIVGCWVYEDVLSKRI